MKIRGGWAWRYSPWASSRWPPHPPSPRTSAWRATRTSSRASRRRATAGPYAADKDYQASNCTSCHTGAKEHAESGGDRAAEPDQGRGAGGQTPTCLSCHVGHKKQALWEGSAHQLAGLKCASCHDVHKMHIGTPEQAKTLPGATGTTKRCLECHGELRASLHQRSSHPMRDGQMQCTSCHNPHGTAGGRS